ncbi:hypothetical protein D9613_011450 [Agrocybe pediades]|uniref:Uncharacterized protein n=1 Tax=Agrocybe pediades TaxID=84607 RepID=A0A8H4QSF1_9AGAR|nr:hypothetical protein D9613_011450 [Agrocybe pediades]
MHANDPFPSAALQKFGNTVDTTSATGFLGSLRNSSKPVSPPQVNVPPAFPARQNSFAPPPRRTASSSSSVNHPPETASPPAPPPPAPRWQPQQPEPEEEEEQGEWVEALYEYDSGVRRTSFEKYVAKSDRRVFGWRTGSRRFENNRRAEDPTVGEDVG